MPDRFKEKVRIRVNRFYTAISSQVEDGDFWSTSPESDTLTTAWEAGSIALPSIPIGDKYLDFSEAYDDNGDIHRYKYVVSNGSNRQLFRYETADDERDSDHVHRYAVPGDHKTARKRPHPQPSIEDLVDEITRNDT